MQSSNFLDACVKLYGKDSLCKPCWAQTMTRYPLMIVKVMFDKILQKFFGESTLVNFTCVHI